MDDLEITYLLPYLVRTSSRVTFISKGTKRILLGCFTSKGIAYSILMLVLLLYLAQQVLVPGLR